MTSILAILMISFGMGFANFGATSQPVALPPGDHDTLAQCLTNSGVIKYGSETCPHCQRQKELFGNSWQYITAIECPEQPELCQEQGINGYPTWIFYHADGSQLKRLEGTQSLQSLANESGCPLK